MAIRANKRWSRAMMLPTNRRPPIDPPPAAPLPVGKTTSAIAAEPVPSHGDYNHQPLLVSGLEHYVKPEEDERFHVS